MALRRKRPWCELEDLVAHLKRHFARDDVMIHVGLLTTAVGAVSFTVTVISASAIVALFVVAAGITCVYYAVRSQGLLPLLPSTARAMLTETSFLDLMTGSSEATAGSLSASLIPMLALWCGLSPDEEQMVLRRLPREAKHALLRPGIMHALPGSIQRLLVPVQTPPRPLRAPRPMPITAHASGSGHATPPMVTLEWPAPSLEINMDADLTGRERQAPLSSGNDSDRETAVPAHPWADEPELQQSESLPDVAGAIVSDLVSARLSRQLDRVFDLLDTRRLCKISAVAGAALAAQLVYSRPARQRLRAAASGAATGSLCITAIGTGMLALAKESRGEGLRLRERASLACGITRELVRRAKGARGAWVTQVLGFIALMLALRRAKQLRGAFASSVRRPAPLYGRPGY